MANLEQVRPIIDSMINLVAVLDEMLSSDTSLKNGNGTSLNCPKCGKRMVKRTNKTEGTPFFGCTGYPKCNHTYSWLDIYPNEKQTVSTTSVKVPKGFEKDPLEIPKELRKTSNESYDSGSDVVLTLKEEKKRISSRLREAVIKVSSGKNVRDVLRYNNAERYLEIGIFYGMHKIAPKQKDAMFRVPCRFNYRAISEAVENIIRKEVNQKRHDKAILNAKKKYMDNHLASK